MAFGLRCALYNVHCTSTNCCLNNNNNLPRSVQLTLGEGEGGCAFIHAADKKVELC